MTAILRILKSGGKMRSSRSDIKNILIAAMGVVIFFMLFTKGCSKRRSEKVIDKLQAELYLKTNQVKTVETRNGKLTSDVKTLETDKKNLVKSINKLGVDNKELKDRIGQKDKLIAFLQVQAKSGDTVYISITDTTYITDTDTVIAVFNYDNGYLDCKNEILSTKKAKFSYKYDLKFDILQGEKRDKWYKAKYPVVNLKFYDPNIVVLDAKSIDLKPKKKKWYQRRIVAFGAGVVGGVIIKNKLKN
jgi:regulator of replication initiation timing